MLYYFAAFEPVENGAFVVRVPDIPEVATQGADLTEAMDMARDAVALSLEAAPAAALHAGRGPGKGAA